mmetsp:Transcript_64038/g.113907  ORF Transcript_64038/g.113907 Transcript_64038/m.113907 type:complete len:251 (+) Transcript_64038:73-825(+)
MGKILRANLTSLALVLVVSWHTLQVSGASPAVASLRQETTDAQAHVLIEETSSAHSHPPAADTDSQNTTQTNLTGGAIVVRNSTEIAHDAIVVQIHDGKGDNGSTDHAGGVIIQGWIVFLLAALQTMLIIYCCMPCCGNLSSKERWEVVNAGGGRQVFKRQTAPNGQLSTYTLLGDDLRGAKMAHLKNSEDYQLPAQDGNQQPASGEFGAETAVETPQGEAVAEQGSTSSLASIWDRISRAASQGVARIN